MDIVTRQETDAWLNAQPNSQLPAGGTPPQLISDVSRELASYTGRIDWGASTSRTEYKDGGTAYLLLDYWPITVVTSIHDDTDHSWGDSTLIDATEYWISLNRNGQNHDGIIIMENFRLVSGDQNVRVIYTAGYTSASDDTIPGDIKLAAFKQILHEITKPLPGSFMRNPGQFANVGFDEFEGINLVAEVRKLLLPYRRSVPFA